ncbi:MAG: aminopeptidase [archaeon]
MSGAKILINKCLEIKESDKVVIVTDKDTLEVAESLMKEAKKAGATPYLYVIKDNERPLKVIPCELMDQLKDITAGMTPFRAIPIEGAFRFELVKMMASSGARVAHMPGITLDIINNPELDGVDFEIIEKHARTIFSALDGAKEIHITSKNGTDLTFDISGRDVTPEGCIIPKGEIFNFPSGEVFVAPLETSANGTFVCDISCGDAGMVGSPMTLEFAGGKLKELRGKSRAKDIIKKDIEEATGKKDLLCEFGIGINPFFKPIGNALTDEKILGTCHVAIGDNTGLGGVNKSSVHIDFIMNKPTIIVDGRIMMREGKLNV